MDRRQAFGQCPKIVTPLGFTHEPMVELTDAAILAQTDTFRAHEQVGRFGVAHIVDQKAIGLRHHQGRQPGIDRLIRKDLAIEDQGIRPLPGILVCLADIEQQRRRAGRIRRQPRSHHRQDL